MSQTCSSIKTNIYSNDLNYLHTNIKQWKYSQHKNHLNNKNVTILLGGMTILQDKLVASALSSLGEKYISLPNADFQSFQIGKAHGNRGQCNPVYFTVGNLIKFLQNLQKKGLSTQEIIHQYVFITAGSCGPCRFGMYLSEYKKALDDTGFSGFRIISFDHDQSIFQKKKEQDIIHFNALFFTTLIKAIIIGDILNILASKIRPYEIEKGSTKNAIEQCQIMISETFLKKRNLLFTLYRCRKIIEKVKLNRLQSKPKVLITGEFWAALVDGDGNYNLRIFLENEGAECIPQPLINRLLLSLWESEYEIDKRQNIMNKSIDFSQVKRKFLIKTGTHILKIYFKVYAKTLGLTEYKIENMHKLASLAKPYYPMDASGGEAFLEVAHLIESIEENLSHMVISVKPFGCMPSSAISDGIQALVLSHYPSVNFLSIETSGESATNFYSRVQMALYKAKKSADEEFNILTKPQKIPNHIHHYRYKISNLAIGTSASLIKKLNSKFYNIFR